METDRNNLASNSQQFVICFVVHVFLIFLFSFCFRGELL